MDLFFKIVGAVCLVAICLSVLLIGVGMLVSAYNERKWQRYNDQKDRFSRVVGAELYEASWWWSEDKATMLAIQLLADMLCKKSIIYSDLADLREKWRKETKPTIIDEHR